MQDNGEVETQYQGYPKWVETDYKEYEEIMKSKIMTEYKGSKNNAVDMINFLLEQICENDWDPTEELAIVTAVRKQLADSGDDHPNYQ